MLSTPAPLKGIYVSKGFLKRKPFIRTDSDIDFSSSDFVGDLFERGLSATNHCVLFKETYLSNSGQTRGTLSVEGVDGGAIRRKEVGLYPTESGM